MTPSEPDGANQAPVGDIPRIPLQMKDSQPEKQEPAPAPLPDIDFNLLNSIVDNAKNNSTSNSRSPSGSRQTPPPQNRNPYDSYAPPPSGHYQPYRGSSPQVNDHRDQYRDQYRRDYGGRPGYDRPHSYERDRPRYGRENSPSGYQRRSRSPQRDQYSRDRNEPYRRPDSYRNQNGGYRRWFLQSRLKTQHAIYSYPAHSIYLFCTENFSFKHNGKRPFSRKHWCYCNCLSWFPLSIILRFYSFLQWNNKNHVKQFCSTIFGPFSCSNWSAVNLCTNKKQETKIGSIKGLSVACDYCREPGSQNSFTQHFEKVDEFIHDVGG